MVTFFSRHPLEQQPPYCFRRLLLCSFHLRGPLYIALSSLILPLRQAIRPFTTNKAF